ncbi:MAG: hypothetical protein EOO36_08590 [Cytophagaceae bacterium]|nr:MAG: hypothetical protein EOO36_08590 [Cytophagaceae bacterium]
MRYRFLFLLVRVLVAGVPRLAAAQTLDAAALAGHHTVAVLPFEVSVDGLRLHYLRYYIGIDSTAATQQHLSAEQQQEARQAAYQMQALVHRQLLKKQPRHGYRVQFQALAETNRRLQAAGITYENLTSQPMDQMRQVLGVDALLSGQVLLYQSVPKGLGLAIRILSSEQLLLPNQPSALAPSQTTASLAVFDCRGDRLAWRYDFARTGPNALKPARLAPRLVRAALPTFPYCQP